MDSKLYKLKSNRYIVPVVLWMELESLQKGKRVSIDANTNIRQFCLLFWIAVVLWISIYLLAMSVKC